MCEETSVLDHEFRRGLDQIDMGVSGNARGIAGLNFELLVETVVFCHHY